jgi:Fe-S-cluster containining protein
MSDLVFVSPTEQRFSCRGCTHCCRFAVVEVDANQAASIRAGVSNRHGIADPFQVDRKTGRIYLERVDGACVFLEADGRCAIHAQLGYAAKPPACRQFPFGLVRPPGGPVIVRASFFCPTIARNEGDPLDAIAPALERDAIVALPATMRLGDASVDEASYQRIEALLASAIEQAPDLARGLATGGALLARLDREAAAAGSGARALTGEALERWSRPEAIADAARSVRPFRRPRDARLLLVPFLLLAVPPEQGRLSRLLHVARLVAGRGEFRSIVSPRPIDLVRHAGVRCGPEILERSGLVRRYLRHLLGSRTLLAGSSVRAAIALVAVAYALVRWNARALATVAGRTAVEESDVFEAVRCTDGYHLLHNQAEASLLRSTVRGRFLLSMLQHPARLAGLVLEQEG